ncbi:MAG TPA: adenylate/guanylate cyclase domain-containing protein [Burkholderiales bacterium]|nr:adenylate/guanylate cyclase domain-containing protein [Burkholderiales bacterium]
MDTVNQRSVLVVDDTPENITLLSGLLRPEYNVKVAPSGERALQIALGETPPDLILLDIMMPEMDGYEVLRRLRAEARTSEIPVIFLTAMTSSGDEERGLEMGAVDYIAKPISPPIVLARVRNHLALAERTKTLRGLADKLSRYLAPQVYRSIFEGRQQAAVSTRRRKLTIFFSDIMNFTDTTEDMAPEDLTFLLNQYFTEMSKIALEYGGTIDKYIGDAIMIFFGDPESRGVEEDALQCVRMAMAMQRRLADLQEQWRQKGYDKPFHQRIGINTGFCNVGNFGSDFRLNYTIIGPEVNLAARLEQAADPSGILMSYETYALVQEEIEAEERPPVRAKGIAREIRAFAVVDAAGKLVSQSRILRRHGMGMKLYLDVDRLNGQDRTTAMSDLREALERLQRLQ